MQIIHISDIHMRIGWYEEQGIVLDAFFKDLEKQEIGGPDCYLAISGDLVQAASESGQYLEFSRRFDEALNKLGIPADNRIVVPGNHDADSNIVKDKLVEHLGFRQSNFDETTFNTSVLGSNGGSLKAKFSTFSDFTNKFAKYSCVGDDYCGCGHELSAGVGVYCLNSALTTFGGQNDLDGNKIVDEGSLMVETRNLAKWLSATEFSYRILVMHHPLEVLEDWASRELRKVVGRNFDLVLCGHSHRQDTDLVVSAGEYCIVARAPALFTRKSKKENYTNSTLGYSIIEVSPTSGTTFRYRSWSEKDTFVLGSSLAGDDSGSVTFGRDGEVNGSTAFETRALLEEALDSALTSYTGVNPIWVDPDIATHPESYMGPDEQVLTKCSDLIASNENVILCAPPQYGLSSLGRFWALKSWEAKTREFVLFLDSRGMKNHEAAVKIYCEMQARGYGVAADEISRIIVDNWDFTNPNSIRQINSIAKVYPNAKITLLVTFDDPARIGETLGEDFDFEFSRQYLWALQRPQIREVVSKYLTNGSKLDENQAFSKVVDHIDALNLHRTPLNCVLLLKIFESQLDSSPINRTEMLSLLLQLLFLDVRDIPRYSAIPDFQDSLHALGCLCEILIREEKVFFTKSEFITTIDKYCKRQMIDIEVDVLFSCLAELNLLMHRRGQYCFRFLHWVYFFAAHRMLQDVEFRTYMMKREVYSRFPEIIEFYSGIDRRRTELLEQFTVDLKDLNEAFEARTGIPLDFDPFSKLRWEPQEKDVEALIEYIEDEAEKSSLPSFVKDSVADVRYDRGKPYNQQVRVLLEEVNLFLNSRVMRSAARALCNSLHADVNAKRALLQEIMATWTNILQVCAFLSPVLAKEGEGGFEGIGYYLNPEFDKYKGVERWQKILAAAPYNVVGQFEKDVMSKKMGPLYGEFLEGCGNDVQKHLMCLSLLRERPKGWEAQVKKVVQSYSKNSFYLFDILGAARHAYRFGYCTSDEANGLRELTSLILSRHSSSKRKVGKDILKSAAEKYLSS